MFNPHYSLSLSDLVGIPDFLNAYAKEDKAAINEVLYRNGMEVSQGYEIVVRNHRNLRNEVVTCERYEGVERIDREWLQSGAASMEAYVASSDPEVQRDMKNMSKQSKGAPSNKEETTKEEVNE